MKQICIGILAHVDAGKTTLSEALLYRAGAIRRLGRVDHQDAFLDTDAQERARGITIFSKQAMLTLPALPDAEETTLTLEEGVQRVLRLREDGMKMKEAVRTVAAQTELNKNDLYEAVLQAER